MTRPNNKLTKHSSRIHPSVPPTDRASLRYLTLILVYRKRLCLAFVGEYASKDIFVVAKVTNAILSGQGIGPNGPLDVHITEA